jgi:hypothetical protein
LHPTLATETWGQQRGEEIAMARRQQTLDGAWDFVHASDGKTRRIMVPQPWQAAFADLRHKGGTATYSRRFDRPALTEDEIALLHFGAAAEVAEIIVNGHSLARHHGGHLPFEVPIPHEILRDINDLTVTCHAPDGSAADDPPFTEMPHGKQSWYGITGGLWQSVQLETRPRLHAAHVAISADMTGRMTAQVTFTGGEAEAEVTLLSPEGAVLSTARTAGGEVALTIPTPRLWSPEDPALHNLRVTVGADVTDHPFGFRSFSSRNGQLLLNGKPWYMRAALDQDYYPEGICTPPSLAFLEDQFRKARELGLNMLRCHIKIPDPRYFDVADRMGMLIWTEIPNVATLTDRSRSAMKTAMEGILHRDGNHPSIVIWTLINEDWGTRLCEDQSHRDWLKGMVDWLRQRDPGRLVVDNSPCHGNFHVKTDINDFHYYRSVPERRAEWDQLTAEFASGADWAWSPFGDAERDGDEPLIVSEFGVWGLPDPAKVQIDGQEPWWMETGHAWGDGAAYPHGVQSRAHALALDRVFGSFEGFIGAVQGYQWMNLKYEIEVMRRHAPIMGYVITEFTDVHWESNGLLDMNRNPRSFHDVFGTINADVVIVPVVDRYAGTGGATFSFSVTLATGGAAVPAGALRWVAGEASGRIAVPATGPVTAIPLGDIALTLPESVPGGTLNIGLMLESDGRVLASNCVTVAVHPCRDTRDLPPIATTDPRIAAFATGLGYSVVAADQAQVILAPALDATDIAAMQAGARYAVFADGTANTQRNLRVDEARREQPFIPIVDEIPGLPQGPESQMPNIALTPRHGTMWRGDWIAGFSWIRREGVFADLPGGPMIDLSYDRIVPHHVMTGFRSWEWADKVHAGLVVGWVHKPAVLLAERQVGRGGLVATTFRLFTEAPGTDPLAATLFDRIVRLAATMVTDT